MNSYFPHEWNFGDDPTDGLGGKIPSDPGTIYVWDDDDDSDAFEKVLHKTSISELIDEAISGHVLSGSGKVEDAESIKIMMSIKKALQDAISKIDDSICT